MILKSYEEILMVTKRKKNTSVDLSELNSTDYLKAIDFITSLKKYFKRVKRSKFDFLYE
ncbi:MAG: hypothetical protein IJ568_01195 [Bacilli bacterium]|nr:hypothetical protein [Bacilli bacterium]